MDTIRICSVKITQEEIIEISETPYQLFNRGIPNSKTNRVWTDMLKKVLCEYLETILVGDAKLIAQQKDKMVRTGKKLQYRKSYYDADFEVRVNELVRRAKEDSKWIDSILITITSKLMDRNKLEKIDPDYIQSSMVKGALKPLKKLFKMTDVPIAWGKIDSLITDDNDLKDKSRGYELSELQKIDKFCDPMERVMIKLGSCSGIRCGAYALKWEHIYKVYEIDDGKFVWEPEEVTESIVEYYPVVCGIIKVYADSNYEYFGLVTPEWLDDLEVYRETWINDTNQIPKDGDPLFKRTGPFVRELHYGGIRKRVEDVVNASKVRTRIPNTKQKYNVPLFNGLRRFFNKQNKKALTKTSKLAALIIKEYQMGHGGMIKLDRNYFKEQVAELIDEYLLAIPLITIDTSARKQIEIESKQKEINELEEKQKVNELLTDKVSDLESKMESYEKQSDMPVITKKDLSGELKKLLQKNPELFLLQP